MDIARTPSTPDGNPHLADAPPLPPTPPMILREDYRPFGWLVPNVRLDFTLGLAETTVRADLQVARNPAADSTPVLRLNGDGLNPLEVLVDGAVMNSWVMEGPDLLVTLPDDAHTVTITTRIDPAANSQLMGLYASGGMLCTQCEAEGFRRITFFPDRPDVLSTYRVRMTGPRADFPVLLSNGDLVGSGDGADGTHWAEWHDPWPKPSYLFALVAGDLMVQRDSFTTMNGREVDLGIYVRAEDEGRTDHAMQSLKRSMKWDEEVFGREYDLGIFNIVAVSDFNMGAMENKGLNVFNTKYVLADPDTATDGDYDAVEGVIAHEYFHNWSGNRITCRDWFQLSLKEGFTVLRDQLFSQDMGSAPVKRIEDVRVLRSVQFPEDSGPLSHPIRPDSFREISNFYTATVYNKGAEVIRMMRTMAGPERFRAGCDLYFQRHDGEAATCEDFVRAMEDGAGLDLRQFRRWYSQAGTPQVRVAVASVEGGVELTLSQTTPATPGQEGKQAVPIPLKLALHDRATGTLGEETLLMLTGAEQRVTLPHDGDAPVLSVNRGFSAPVVIRRDLAPDDLVFLAARDDDPFARYEAMQDLVVGHLLSAVRGEAPEKWGAEGGRAAIRDVLATVLADDGIDDLMRGELLILPGETYLAEQLPVADPGRIHTAREALKGWLGQALEGEFLALHHRASRVGNGFDAEAKGARKVKTQALVFLAAGNPGLAAELATAQYDASCEPGGTMTDRQGGLLVLAGLDSPARTARLLDFYNRHQDNPLVIDKWFSLQAQSLHRNALAHVQALAQHPDFTLRNPNRARSLFMAFVGNANAFHAPGGEGYRMIADTVLALDPLNPQTAARFVPPLGRWRRIEPGRAALMREQLERIAAAPRLSRDTFEQVSRSLG